MIISPFSISGLVLSVTCVLLLLIIIRSARTSTHHIWAFFNFSVAVWGLGSFFMQKGFGEDVAVLWIKIAHAGVTFIAVSFFHLVCSVCNLKRRSLLVFAYIQGIVFCLLLFGNQFISRENISILFNQFYYDKANGALYYIYFSIWIYFIMYGHFELVRKYLSSKGVKRNQILYFFFGMIVGFSGGLTNFMPVFGLNIYPIGNFTIPIYCIIVTYAILKYSLLDIKMVVTRAGIFIAVYSFVLGIPLVVAFRYQDLLISIFNSNWWIFPLVTSTVLATIGPFIYLYIDKKAEYKLLQEQKSYQSVLKGASSGMIRIKNLSRLLDLIVRVVAKTVKIRHTSVYLYDEEVKSYKLSASRGLNLQLVSRGDIADIDAGSPLVWTLANRRGPVVNEEEIMRLNDDPFNQGLLKLVDQLKDLRAALVVPSFVDKRLIGILILGEKRSGKMYSQDDLNVFLVLANQAALAIENAQFYDEIKNTHQQLFQAEKLATIGTMADGLSHQINNRFHALSLIAGDALDVLKTSDFSTCDENAKANLADIKSALERIEANVMQGGEVVKGLLKYSRPGDGGFEMVDFRDVLTGAIDMVQFKIKLKEIDLVQSLPVDIPKVHANTIQLQEVFFNLIDNAYDATQERRSLLKEEGYRGRIEISASGAEDHLVVNIADNGMGIKEVDKKKLFTPFFTTKATAKKGTGLGLYVIERIVAAHGGKIDIQSVHEQGTMFIISLPTRPKPAA